MNDTLALVRALVFLQTRSLVNALKVRLRRLKQPKYLIGAVVGLGYLYLWIGRHMIAGFRRGPQDFEPPTELFNVVEAVAAVILFFVVAAMWIFTGSRASLQFTEPELAFLLPAPLSRKMLVRYKLIRAQFGTLLSALFLTLFTGRMARDGHAFIHVFGWWLGLTFLNLHSIAASFTVQRLTERGLASWVRRLGAFLVVAAIVSVVLLWLRSVPPPPTAMPANFDEGARGLREWVELATSGGPAPWLLAPFRWVVKPWFTTDTVSFLLSLGPVLALIGLHYWWVERCDVRFEEASVDAARKRADLMAAARAGKHRGLQAPKKAATAPFPLPSQGPAPVALLWKHLIHVRLTPRRAAYGLGVVALLAVVVRLPVVPEPLAIAIAGIFPIAAAVLALVGGNTTSMPFRRDLNELDVLKGFPLPAWQIVLGQLLGGAAVIGLVQVLVALGGVLCYRPANEDMDLSLPMLVVIAVSYVIVVLPLNFVNALVPSAATLLFPAWAKPSKDLHNAGFEIMGQRLLLGLAQLLAAAVAWLPAALLGVAAFFLGNWMGGLLLAVPLAALFASAVLIGEAAAGIWGLGKLFERYDASAEQ